MKIHREWKGLAKELTDAGYELRHGGSGHILIINADGKRVGALPSSPSDRRGIYRKRAELKYTGVLT